MYKKKYRSRMIVQSIADFLLSKAVRQQTGNCDLSIQYQKSEKTFELALLDYRDAVLTTKWSTLETEFDKQFRTEELQENIYLAYDQLERIVFEAGLRIGFLLSIELLKHE